MITRTILHFYIYLSIPYYGLSSADPLVGKKVKPAKENEFPFFVSLSSSSNITEKNHYFCGGMLVSKRHVITSEHCIDGEDHNITLIVNPANLHNRSIYKIESWITYDDWALDQNILTEDIDNDIAIITLSEDVRDVTPAVISKLKYERMANKRVVAAGWGHVNEVYHLTTDSLMKAYLTVLDYKKYRENTRALFGKPLAYRLNFYYTSASPPAVLACGDSGGPLMLASNQELIGINDSGYDKIADVSNPHATSRHISLDYYRTFIEDIAKD